MRLRYPAVGFAALAIAAAIAATASAAPFRPAVQGLPFVQLTAAAVQQAPTCQRGLLCYTPQMIRDAYDFPNGKGGATGAGQTIIVVDAYGSPFLSLDVAAFDAQFGLAPANLVQFPPLGPIGTSDPQTLQQWGLETSLDVEWASAMAPGARIVLATATSDDPYDLYQVEQAAAAAYPGAIVAQSFGTDESGDQSSPEAEAAFDQLFASIDQQGGTVVASSGDLGATDLTPFFEDPTPMPVYPASSPLVLAVGGTEGNPYPGGLLDHGHYGGEQVWNEVLTNPDGSPNPGASGGAPSTVYPRPIWQAGFTSSHGRAEPDVAYNAAANGGVIIAYGGQFGVIGGTSAGAPQWAAILALANELRAKSGRPGVGLVTPQLYALARDKSTYKQDFHDITVGSNDLGNGQFGLPGFQAGPGYDYPTGLGTPDVARLIKDLAGRDALSLRLTDLLTQHGKGKGHAHFGPGR